MGCLTLHAGSPNRGTVNHMHRRYQSRAERQLGQKKQGSVVTDTFYKIGTDEELDALVDKTLAEAGTTIDELRRQGRDGRFESEKLRRAWFVVHGVGRI